MRPSPREFLRRWESRRPPISEVCDACGVRWLVNPDSGARLSGYGGFNPLREANLADIRSDHGKQTADIGKILEAVRSRLGHPIADYCWKHDYDVNLDLGGG